MTEIGGCSNNKDELKVELSTSYRRYLNNCNGEEDNAFVYQGALHSPGLVMENPFEIPSHPALVCIYTTPGRTCTGWPRQTNLRGQRNEAGLEERSGPEGPLSHSATGNPPLISSILLDRDDTKRGESGSFFIMSCLHHYVCVCAQVNVVCLRESLSLCLTLIQLHVFMSELM